jgi:hypothetical protein
MKNLLISNFAAAVILLFGSIAEVNGDLLTYEVVGATITIRDCKETASGALAIPPTYDGKPVTRIGENAFRDCSNLTSVTIPDNVTRIGNKAFADCSSLMNVTISNNVTRIGEWAFEGCSSLTSMNIGNSVIRIGEYAFNGCTSLTSVTIPDSVISIYNGTFEGCTSLIIINFRDVYNKFGGDSPKLNGAKVFINPDAIGFGETYGGLPVVYKTVLPTDHFTYKVSGNTVTIRDCKETISGALAIPLTYDGKPVISIGNIAFRNCYSLTSVIIGNNVTSIGNWAFDGCHSLTNMTIPDSVTRIGSFAFRGCSSLKSITFEGNAPSSLGTDVFKYLSIGATITVPVGATGFAEMFEGFPVIIQGALEINIFRKTGSTFTISFESKLGATYVIEVTHDLKQWDEIGEIKGTGSSVEFTDWREAHFQKQYYRLKLLEE